MRIKQGLKAAAKIKKARELILAIGFHLIYLNLLLDEGSKHVENEWTNMKYT